MLMTTNKTLEKKRIYILIFIHKITTKTMQDLIFFLQKNKFTLKRITKNSVKKKMVFELTNSNFILENHCEVNRQQLRTIFFFLKQHTNINGIFFKNQVLNRERIESFERQPQLDFWKQINNWII